LTEEIPREIRGYLDGLLRKLRGVDPHVEVYLIGSYARGDWLRDSDIDLIIVSKAFKGLDLGRRYRLVKELAGAGFGLDLLTYTPEEFKKMKKRSIIIQDALEYAIKLC